MHESKIHAYKEQDEVLFYKWAKLIYYFFQRKKYIKKESFPFFLLPWPILGQVSWLSSKVGIKGAKAHESSIHYGCSWHPFVMVLVLVVHNLRSQALLPATMNLRFIMDALGIHLLCCWLSLHHLYFGNLWFSRYLS